MSSGSRSAQRTAPAAAELVSAKRASEGAEEADEAAEAELRAMLDGAGLGEEPQATATARA